jgi:hypothetical protein
MLAPIKAASFLVFQPFKSWKTKKIQRIAGRVVFWKKNGCSLKVNSIREVV